MITQTKSVLLILKQYSNQVIQTSAEGGAIEKERVNYHSSL